MNRGMWLMAASGGGTLVLDQISKVMIGTWMYPGESRPLIPGLLYLTYVKNTGGVFGVFPRSTWVFIVSSLVLLGAFFVAISMARNSPYARFLFSGKLSNLGVGAVVGGALGNLVDRLRFGAVVDFLDFRVWPVFNLADIGIVVGVVALGYHFIFCAQRGEDGEAG
ncbi:MAG TPA: signal peptidase II [Clostridia bacterium]|nr:signal peptidase II [Clostridia bacterium]